jgi:hypothetical protein
MRQPVLILALAALFVSGCAGGGSTTTPAIAPSSAALQPQSVARQLAAAHHDADECDDRDSKHHDDHADGCPKRCADRDDRHDRDGHDGRDARNGRHEHDRDGDRDDCPTPTPSPSPTPVPSPRPAGPLSLTCDASAVQGNPANCVISNPSFTGAVAMSYSGPSLCTGPASVNLTGATAQFQVLAGAGGGCHVVAQANAQQAAADINYTR